MSGGHGGNSGKVESNASIAPRRMQEAIISARWLTSLDRAVVLPPHASGYEIVQPIRE